MNVYQLIKKDPISVATTHPDVRVSRKKDSLDGVWVPDGYAYVLNEPLPTDAPDAGKKWVRSQPTLTTWGWQQVDVPAEAVEVPDLVELWRIRTVAELTPHGDGNLLQSIEAEIAGITDPAEKVGATQLFATGDHLEREASLLNEISTKLGLTSEEVDALFITAEQFELND